MKPINLIMTLLVLGIVVFCKRVDNEVQEQKMYNQHVVLPQSINAVSRDSVNPDHFVAWRDQFGRVHFKYKF